MPDRFPCQVCGHQLVPLKDGTSRRHGPGRCTGSGYRLAPWAVGQRLRHYAGSVWEVVSFRPYTGRSYEWMVEYTMRCLSDPSGTSGREVGSTDTFHGEYMHRHGWRPVDAMTEEDADGPPRRGRDRVSAARSVRSCSRSGRRRSG